MIGTSEVKGIEHSWLTDTLAAQTHEEQLASEVMAKNKIEGERAHIEDVNSFCVRAGANERSISYRG